MRAVNRSRAAAPGATAPTATAAKWDRRSSTGCPRGTTSSSPTLIHAGSRRAACRRATSPMPRLAALVKFLRIDSAPARGADRPADGSDDGREDARRQVIGEGFDDLQLLTDDKRVHLLRRAGDRVREVTSEQPTGPTYNGDPGGNRYTTLTQIDKTNVARLAPKWVFTIPGARQLCRSRRWSSAGSCTCRRRTSAIALDAGTGRQIWHTSGRGRRASTAGGANRGVAVAGDRVFMETDNAHLIALNRFTGELLWDTELADWRKNYSATSAPLPAGNLVISGVTGGEHGANGFVAAHDQETGKEVWRFWTVPQAGRAGIGNLGGQGHRARRRADLVHRQLRSGARYRLLADRQSRQGVQRRRSQGGQPLFGLHPGARREDRQAEVALPVHAARSVGLGRDADLGAVDAELGGAAAQADAARQPQRVLLRLRSHGRQAAAGEAVRQDS